MANRDFIQTYLCHIGFPGKKPLWFGTVLADGNAPHHEVEVACRTKIGEYLPDGWTLLKVVPGAMFMRPVGKGWDVE